MKEVTKARLEVESLKRQLYQQEIAYNIQQTEALTRSLSPTPAEATFGSHSSFDTHSLPRRLTKHLDDDVKVRKITTDFNFLHLELISGLF